MTRHTRCPRNCAPAKTTMLAPMAQITCITTPTRPSSCSIPHGAKLQAVATTNHSMKISHTPRLNRNAPNADGVLRDVIRPALVPARNTNTGAQKCVIQRVKKSAAPMPGLAIGSASPPKLK